MYGFTTEKTKTRDTYNLGFAMSKTKEYLQSDCHLLGRMLRAPSTRWRVSWPSKSSHAFEHLLLIADKCIHSTAGPGWSKENSFHLAKKSVQLAKVRASGKKKNKKRNLSRELGETPAAGGRIAETITHPAPIKAPGALRGVGL